MLDSRQYQVCPCYVEEGARKWSGCVNVGRGSVAYPIVIDIFAPNMNGREIFSPNCLLQERAILSKFEIERRPTLLGQNC